MTAVATTLRLRRAARGDAAAFAAVYERHHQALYRYCRSILRHEEDAQDALQSTMTKAFAALQQDRRDFELKPWLFRIAHNEAVSILRRRRETAELGDIPDLAPMEDLVIEREELRALQMDLADLPDRQRAALVLRELNGLSHAEIGKVLDLTPTAVKHTIFEARNALFMCREGREMRCHDVRRMLSDGDGRVLRGRGVRAHLRTCGECRAFRDDLTRRPVALKMLAPPLPTAAAASLLAQLAGGGTAAKVLCCVALAGGGATLAVEVQQARETPPAAAREAAPAPTVTVKTRSKRIVTPPPASTPAAVVVVASTPQPRRAAKPAPKDKVKQAVAKPKRHAKAPRKHVIASEPAPTPSVVVEPKLDRAAAKAEKQAAKVQRKAEKQAVKEQRTAAKPVPPGKVNKRLPAPAAALSPPTEPPGQVNKDDKPQLPRQANKHADG
jgi:RNA polymerase sigma factor (sigma-70 family)